jgi:type II secretory pathway pseudopilin PulG
MIKIFNGKKGFTVTELIAASLIIVITAGGTFSAYLISIYFGNKFRHKSMAMAEAARVVDELRYRNKYSDLTVSATPASVTTSGWGINSEVNNLSAEYTISEVWFTVNGTDITETTTDPGTGTAPFKKIVLTVNWNERESGV